jgi:signal transduction histidine kinase/HAMP domain-containing protein
MLRLTGITARTTMLAWTITLATLAIFVVVIIPEQKHDLQVGLESKAQGVAAALQGEVASAAISEDYSSVIDHAMQVLSGDKNVDFLVITKNDGYALIVERDSWRIDPKIDNYWYPGQRQSSGAIESVSLFHRRLYHYAAPFDYSGLQWGWIHVGLSLDSYDTSVSQIYRRTGLLAVVCIVLSLVASLLYARRFTDPILRLRAVVEQVASGNLTARANIHSKDEIEQLASAFNGMADAVLQRNRIVESVRFTAQALQGTSRWGQVMELVLEKIGQASDASRVLAWKWHTAAQGNSLARVSYEWRDAETPTWITPNLDLNLAEESMKELVRRLAQGEMVTVRLDQQKALMIERPKLPPLSEIIVPILAGDLLWGALAVHDCKDDRVWSEVEQDSVRAVAEMLGASIVRENALQELFESKNELENRVLERTCELQKQVVAKDKANVELEEAQKRVIELSRLSGMAEVATSVLHNVGNVLNSINVSSTLVGDRLRTSRLGQLKDMVRLLRENQTDIGAFLLHDPKGQRILPYLDKLCDHLVQERDEMSTEMAGLVEHVGHVKDIISLQQTYARTSGVLEKVAFPTLIEDSLRITREEMDRHGVQMRTEIEEMPPMTTDRNKILQILLNLLRNAKDAVKVSHTIPRVITVRLRAIENGFLSLEIADSGVGIAPENLTRVFSHGFTTKKNGHGFGLHFGALTASQLGGSLSVESKGVDRGATFKLVLPIDPKNIGEQRRTQ